jgi:hypothetical protein
MELDIKNPQKQGYEAIVISHASIVIPSQWVLTVLFCL